MATEQLRLPRIRTLAASGTVRSLRSSMWGFADQGLISATNFITMVLLARQLGPKAFGVFVLAYTALLFSNNLQNALFTGPHNVLGANKTGADYTEYTSSTFRLQMAFSTVIGLCIGAIGITLAMIDRPTGYLVIAIAFATATWQIQEFCRRVFYTQRDYRTALSNDIITYGGQTLGMVLLWQSGQLTGTRAILCITIASAAGALAGAFRLRHVLFDHVGRTRIRECANQNWEYGRWLLGSTMASWISSQLYPLLAAGFVGVAATGGLRASRNLIAPTNILLSSLDTMIPTRGARIYRANGASGLRRFGYSFGVPAFVAMATYCLLIFVAAKPLLTHLLGPAYSQYSWLAQAYSVVYLLTITSQIPSLLLRSSETTRPLLYAYLASSIFVLTIGVLLVWQLGLVGVMIGLIVHVLTLNVVLWYHLHRRLSEKTM